MNNLTIQKCNAVTKKGIPCKKVSMIDSDYCYVHTLGKFRGIPILKNFTAHLLTLISIILAIIFFSAGPSSKHQETIIKKIDDIEVLVKEKIDDEKDKKRQLVSDLISKSFFDILTEVIRIDFLHGINSHFDMGIKDKKSGKILRELRFVDIQNNFENYRHVALIVKVLDTEIFNFQQIIDSGLKKSSGIQIIAGTTYSTEKFDSKNLVFTRNLYIYYKNAKINTAELRESCKKDKINLILRDSKYWSQKVINKDNL